MLSVIVETADAGDRLPALLAALTSAAVEGLVREVLIAGGGPPELLAVLREALSNVARHAGATRADVTVSIADTDGGCDLVLTVQDNGSGIKPGSRRSGLANMADRASALGGSLRAEPAADGGTALEWRVPITDRP